MLGMVNNDMSLVTLLCRFVVCSKASLMKDSFVLYQFVCEYNIIIIFTSIMNGRLHPKQVISTVQKLLLCNLILQLGFQTHEILVYVDKNKTKQRKRALFKPKIAGNVFKTQ